MPRVALRVALRMGFSHDLGQECKSESCSENAQEFRELLREWPFHSESVFFQDRGGPGFWFFLSSISTLVMDKDTKRTESKGISLGRFRTPHPENSLDLAFPRSKSIALRSEGIPEEEMSFHARIGTLLGQRDSL